MFCLVIVLHLIPGVDADLICQHQLRLDYGYLGVIS